MDPVLTRRVPQNIAAEKYRELQDKRSREELSTLAQIKRFMERYSADPRFRDALTHGEDEPQRVTETYGIRIDPRLALPLFHPDHVRYRFSEEARRWPLAKLWDDYATDMLKCRDVFQQSGNCAGTSPRLHAWRQRQIRRCKNELGSATAAVITHPILALELSAGCSVGCWFCGVSAERFQGNFLYTRDNALLWQSILEQAVDVFGLAAQTGFCYWATDPADNPDYPKFIEDYYFVTGSLPQTTTAAPLRDLDFTREVLRLSNRYRCMNTRFSILTLKTLDAVHKAFTAEELLNVELVLQNQGSLIPKTLAGRAKERYAKLGDDKVPAQTPAFQADQSTIACVSGFLINMVSRTIQLITPTRTTERWPLGYRVYGERRFETVKQFRAALDDLIAMHMPEEIGSRNLMAFREGLCYRRTPKGFELSNAHGRFALGGFEGAGELGDLIHEGHRTAAELRTALLRAGGDVFAVADAMAKLFAAGLLNEDPKADGIGSRTPAMATEA